MNITDLAKQLGEAIQQDERYTKTIAAEDACNKDEALQSDLKAFNEARDTFFAERQKEGADEQKCTELNKKMREAYDKLMANEHLAAYQDAKAELDALVGEINGIINYYVTGEEPCTHNCATCGGCH